MKKFFPLTVLAIFVIIVYGCSSDDGGGTVDPGPVPEPRLVVEQHQDPGISSVNHIVWDSIAEITVPIGTTADYNSGVGVTTINAKMKALRTATNIYLRVVWADNDKDTRYGEYKARWFGLPPINWEEVDTTLFSNEDRFYILFDQGGTNGADCATMCHSVANGSGRKFCGAAGDDADVWHWKAARTGLGGFAEDMQMTTTIVDPDDQTASNDNLYFRNWNPIGHPAKMHPDTTAWTGDALLEGTYINFENDLDWVQGLPNDTINLFVPGYYLNHISGADGSRWDVEVIQVHDGTNWTVVFRRALDTGDTDDINLTSSDSVAISIAVGDNNGVKHWGRAPFYMVFQ